MDYYKILGVDKSVTPEQLKQAYRRLASKHHPDKGGDTSRFQEIEEAYRVLSYPNKRAQYDNPSPFGNQRGGSGFTQADGTHFDFDSIFNMFGAQFRQANQRPQSRMSLWISLYDVATGGDRIVSVGTPTGSQEININIPAGIQDGENIRYPGLGPSGSDLIVQFRVRPDRNWQRHNNDLLTEYSVNIWTLIRGGTIKITDIRGQELEIGIPPRTQPGTMLRARNRGLPTAHGQIGDLLVRVQGQIPAKI